MNFHKTDILLLQFVYEFYSSGSSITVKDKNSELYINVMMWEPGHLDKLDEHVNFMKNLAIILNLKLGDKVIGQVDSWLGYVGFMNLTWYDPSFTINIHKRTKIPHIATYISNILANKECVPISYALRYNVRERLQYYLSHSVMNIMNYLSTVPLCSPYYVMSYIPLNAPDSTYTLMLRDADKLIGMYNDEIKYTNHIPDDETHLIFNTERKRFRNIQFNMNMPVREIIDMLSEIYASETFGPGLNVIRIDVRKTTKN